MPRNAALQANQRNETQGSTPTTDDVDKIRDIIFGTHMREYSTRFDQLEKDVGEKIDQLGKDLEKRLDRLTQRLSTEKEERKDADATTRGQLRELDKRFKAKIAETDIYVAAEVEDLQGALEEEQNLLISLVDKAKAEINKSLTAEATRLDRQKLASKDLAQLFAELARTLKQESK